MARQATSGNAYNFLNTPSHVTFSGGDLTGDGSTLTFVSDWVNLPEAYDNTKDYLVSAQFGGALGSGAAYMATGTATGDTNWYSTFLSTDTAATVNKVGNYSGPYPNSSTTMFVQQIDIQASVPFVSKLRYDMTISWGN